jgi:D-alanyl-D-alanine dipeptidase
MRRLVVALCLLGCSPDGPGARDAETAPAAAPAELRATVGEYTSADADTFSILEDDGGLVLLPWHGEGVPMEATSKDAFAVTGQAGALTLSRDPEGGVAGFQLGDEVYSRLTLGAEGGGTFQITPVLPVEELLTSALDASPPEEEGDFLPSDLVELATLDTTIALDVRYASTNNFMGEVFYSQPRAFLQRPAAEALVRAHRWLEPLGYGLLIHDGYRPWYVTKMFWDATPESLKVFVADPASGSRHNRGAAVDLTLFDRATGAPIEMPGGYDEFSPRSFPDYPGGTTRQRWHRELLREAMEREGFTVYEAEWWHFDFDDWRRYRIGNARFEDLRGR